MDNKINLYLYIVLVVVRSFWSRGVRPCIAGGPLKGSYHLNSIVFNWGLSDDNGSKHSIDRMQFPLEMQLIHLKSEHESLEDAIQSENRDSVAVVSFLFEVSSMLVKQSYEIDNLLLDIVFNFMKSY